MEQKKIAGMKILIASPKTSDMHKKISTIYSTLSGFCIHMKGGTF